MPELVWIAQTSPQQFQRVLNDTVAVSYASAHAFAEVTSSLRIPAAITFLGSVGATRAHRYKIDYDTPKPREQEAPTRGRCARASTCGEHPCLTNTCH